MNNILDKYITQLSFLYERVPFKNMNELLYILFGVLVIYYLFGNVLTLIGLIVVLFWIYQYWEKRDEINKKIGISYPWNGKI
jgi:hypothetical protein